MPLDTEGPDGLGFRILEIERVWGGVSQLNFQMLGYLAGLSCRGADPNNKLALAGVNLDSWTPVVASFGNLQVDACRPAGALNPKPSTRNLKKPEALNPKP